MKLPVGATIMTVCGIAVLIGLGTWQMQRLEWKNSLIEKLNAGYEGIGEAAPLDEQKLMAWSNEEAPLGYGTVSGHLMREKAILLGPRMHDGRAGYHLLIPMTIKGEHTLIVNTGWVDGLWKDDLEERLAVLPGDVMAAGVVHKPDWSSFASKNSPSNDMWFRADITQIAKEKDIPAAYPFMLYADTIEPPLRDVSPHQERWLPRNKHLQYALFWYALGICLAGVYGFYVAGYQKKKAL